MFKQLNEIFIIFLLSECGETHPIVFPEANELSSAIVHEEYQEHIDIQDGPVNEFSVSVNITPAGSGLMWKPEEIKYNHGGEEGINKNYHHLIIYGIPQKTDGYNIIVSGFSLGTMYQGKDFYKKYTLEIKQ